LDRSSIVVIAPARIFRTSPWKYSLWSLPGQRVVGGIAAASVGQQIASRSTLCRPNQHIHATISFPQPAWHSSASAMVVARCILVLATPRSGALDSSLATWPRCSATALARTGKGFLTELRGRNGQIALGTKKHIKSYSHRIYPRCVQLKANCDARQSNLVTTVRGTAWLSRSCFGDGAGGHGAIDHFAPRARFPRSQHPKTQLARRSLQRRGRLQSRLQRATRNGKLLSATYATHR
jgi:hypothetical protein